MKGNTVIVELIYIFTVEVVGRVAGEGGMDQSSLRMHPVFSRTVKGFSELRGGGGRGELPFTGQKVGSIFWVWNAHPHGCYRGTEKRKMLAKRSGPLFDHSPSSSSSDH